MRHYFLLITILSTLIFYSNSSDAVTKALIFGKTIRPIPHGEIIPIAGSSLEKYLNAKGVKSLFTQDTSLLTDSNLDLYDVLILIDVSEGVIDVSQQKVIESFFTKGKGLVAIHATISAGKDWAWFQDLLGTKFVDHAPIQNGVVRLNRIKDRAYSKLPKEWVQFDEWFNFSNPIESPREIVCFSDESSYSGGKMGKSHPIAWQLARDNSRFFYTSMGHPADLYSKEENAFLQLILAATQWTAKIR